MRIALSILAFVVLPVLVANGDIVVTLNEYEIAAAPNQLISIFVQSPGLPDPQVTGFNLRAQIGDGLLPNAEPVFQSIVFAGGIWDAFPFTTTGGPIGGAEQFAQASVVFNTTGDSVIASGLLLSLIIDASGFANGDLFDLKISNTQIGADSDFILAGGSSLVPTITNGTIRIIPEPAFGPLIVSLILAMSLRIRRDRSSTTCKAC